jgi:hypothetical protein
VTSLDALTLEEFTKEYIFRIEWALNAEGSDSLRRDLLESPDVVEIR